jgi:hypothetical protein
MMRGKCFGILIEGIGGGAQGAPIADIAGIARDRKTKAYRGSTQMNADQEWGWKAEVCCTPKMRQR